MTAAVPTYAKFLIGLAAALLAGWISHGPLGRGEAFLVTLEARAAQVVREAELPGVQVRFPRDPLSRVALLSGPANDFQREGQGRFPGINDRIRAMAGVSGLRWEDSAADAERRTIPLLLETQMLAALAYLIGLGLGWLIFRPRREGYL